MIVKKTRVILLITFFICTTVCASANTKWKCNINPVGESFPITIIFTETTNTFSGVLDEYSGKESIYEIQKKDKDQLTAILNYLSYDSSGKSNIRLSIILLNKKNGDFRMYGLSVFSKFEDKYQGKCSNY